MESASVTSDLAESVTRESKTVAVIDIGATSVRMAVAEINDRGDVKPLEALSQAVGLGQDVFIHGQIGRETIEDCVHVLNIYREKLTEYQIKSPHHIRVVATSAVREAQNRLAFLDRLYIATGLEVEPFDEAELHRVTFLGIQPMLADPAISDSAQVLVCEVGGGSTEALVVHDGNVGYARTFRLGSLRLRKTIEAHDTPARLVRSVMERQIARTAIQLKEQLVKDEPLHLVAMGGDLRFAVSQILPNWDHERLAALSLDRLVEFTDQLVNCSVDDLVNDYHLNFPDAETLVPALLAYIQIGRVLGVSTIHVANANLRDGLLKEMASREAWTAEFSSQIIRAAVDLGRRYHFDETHAMHVARLSRELFQRLAPLHQLDSRFELILYIAAILHEIGVFVSHRSLHKHSMYLIRNSDLFGLGKRDLLLVSLVARYHRRASPLPGHEGYSELTREDRVVVAKLAALLRLAKSLDDARSQRIEEFECRIKAGQIVIEVPRIDDLSLERIALQQNGALFEEVFGKRLVLRSLRM